MNENTERRMRRVVRFIDTISDWLGGNVFSLMTLALLFVVCFEVISRYVFGEPTDWAFELTYMIYGSYFMLGSAYTLLKGGHVRTDIFYNDWSFRTRGILDSLLFILAFFPGMAFFFWIGLQEFIHAWETLERSDVTPWGATLVPFKASIPVTAALLLIQGVSELLKSLYAAVKNEEMTV